MLKTATICNRARWSHKLLCWPWKVDSCSCICTTCNNCRGW